jgi:hypothetical protein
MTPRSTGEDELDLAHLLRNGLNLAVVHAFDAADDGRITWITEGGVRIAAIAPVERVTGADQPPAWHDQPGMQPETRPAA